MREEHNAQPSMLARAEEIQQQIQQISGRDLQLWSIGVLLILVSHRRAVGLCFSQYCFHRRAWYASTKATCRSSSSD